MPAIHMPVCMMFSNYMVKRFYYKFKENQTPKNTSAQAFGRTRRPIRPASLALNTFSNNGTTVDFKLLSHIKGNY